MVYNKIYLNNVYKVKSSDNLTERILTVYGLVVAVSFFFSRNPDIISTITFGWKEIEFLMWRVMSFSNGR